VHVLLLGGTAAALALALLPPFVGSGVRAALMEGFTPVCHQIPGRSPHLSGVALAICDRCVGIYSGLVFGLAAASPLKRSAGVLLEKKWSVLVVGLLPAGIDWVGPFLGLWHSVPVSRGLTGLLAGLAIGAVVYAQLHDAGRGGN